MIRIGDATRLSGTRIQNRCAVTSTGVDAIDTLLGGGLPLSSVYVVSETNCRRFAPILQNYFLAEGLIHEHNVFVHGPCLNVKQLLETIPRPYKPANDDTFNATSSSTENKSFQIAWRYQTMPLVNSCLSAKDKTKFDLSTSMPLTEEAIETFSTNSYITLWQQLYRLAHEDKFLVGKGNKLLRVLLTEIGSPRFKDGHKLRIFLGQLRALLQRANIVVMLSVDDSLLSTEEQKALTSIADAYFRLDARDIHARKDMNFEDDKYHGRFIVEKLPLLNSIVTHKPDCIDLVFEKRRRYLEIRLLHLPAVMGGDVKTNATTPCQKVLEQF